MLTHLSIKNLAIASHLELEFSRGMTALSGETGAGKSIVLDALGLALGDRGSADIVRHGCAKAEVAAVFDISALPAAQHWLEERDLDQDRECILRRTVSAEGRSRTFINGQPLPMQQLRELGAMLVDIHSQHEHQSLLQKTTQLRLLDEYGQLQASTSHLAGTFRQWQKKSRKLKELQENAASSQAQLQLLTYQVDELQALELKTGEIEELENRQQQLANAETILSRVQHVGEGILRGDGGCLDQIREAIGQLQQLDVAIPTLDNAIGLLEEARIQLEEAGNECRQTFDSIDVDSAQLTEVENRLELIYDLARKHRIQPERLLEHQQQLESELAQLNQDALDPELLEAQVAALEEEYQTCAKKLSKSRQDAAKNLEKAVARELSRLGMSAEFKVALQPITAAAQGLEEVEFLISPNPGQPAKPLRKIASGGELSRISLAIQVVTAATSDTPTLVFDEVDVGIGGPTAEIVGKMLRKLGETAQILCVTHLAQVASQAHHHLFVRKEVVEGNTQSQIDQLSGKGRVNEIARMLSGVDITEHSLAHAHEMLNNSVH